MKTEFALLAVYNSPLIPLKDFCENEMGIKLQTARNRIASGTFPVKVTPMGSKLMVHVADAAAYIDQQRDSAA